MDPRQTFVVGYDASPPADAALRWAVEAARAVDARLEVRVVASALDPVVGAHGALETLYANRRMAHAMTRLDDLGVSAAHVAIVRGAVAPALVDAAGGTGTIVVGSDGGGPHSGPWHGSVSRQVVRSATGPVVVVRGREDPRSRRVVVGFDGSAAALVALGWAARHAAGTGQDLLAVTVLDGDQGRTRARADRARAGADLAVLRLRRELAALRRRHPGLRAESEIRIGDAAEVLVARSSRASLLVTGARVRDPVRELALGSIVRELLGRARCPVAVLHGADQPSAPASLVPADRAVRP